MCSLWGTGMNEGQEFIGLRSPGLAYIWDRWCGDMFRGSSILVGTMLATANRSDFKPEAVIPNFRSKGRLLIVHLNLTARVCTYPFFWSCSHDVCTGSSPPRSMVFMVLWPVVWTIFVHINADRCTLRCIFQTSTCHLPCTQCHSGALCLMILERLLTICLCQCY